MTTADKLTASRILLAPVFFAAFFLYRSGLVAPLPVLAALWLLFIYMEVSDLLDGMAARSSSTVSDFGKLFDPFADVLARLTYFICFAVEGIMPIWILLLVLYREYSILFLRMLLTRRGISMGARPGGKAKAVVYMSAGLLSLAVVTLRAFPALPGLGLAETLTMVAYALAAVLSVASFIDYIAQYRKLSAS
ncbi:MAG TPA: CDP-diacylglycerol--glycerol-3-phosphate 3-phosphatidyltransferase [Spirochaetales bacterium]|nr:CDP-diacylglycerol--glycerol-3-phosphate 3-phosphatidyltransferase [Spirochaetales bacterium]